MQTDRLTRVAVSVLGLAPGYTLAHGEEVILFPIGTLIALGAVFFLGTVSRLGWVSRLFACVVAIVVSLPWWVIPGDALPIAMQHTEWGNFVIGFVPSFLTGGLALWAVRMFRYRGHDV